MVSAAAGLGGPDARRGDLRSGPWAGGDPQPEDPQPGVVSVGRAGLANVDFRKARFDKFQLDVANFVACDFRGLRLDEKFAPFFVTRPRSTFVSCKFDGADLRLISPEGTRFERCSFETIVAAGPNSALPHAHAGDRRLHEGDLVVLDFGGVYTSYCVDLTRTVSIGKATPRGREVYAAVLEAHDRAIA